MALTAKQQRFVRAYARSLSATQAALDAGYAGGDRERAAQSAWRIMKHPEVRAAIDGLRKRSAIDDTLSAQRVLEELRRVAFADLRSLYRDDGTVKPVAEWTADQGSAVQEVTINASALGTKTVKVRNWDKTKALELLAKHYALTADRTEVSGNITISWLAPEASQGPVVDGETVPVPELPPGPPQEPPGEPPE